MVHLVHHQKKLWNHCLPGGHRGQEVMEYIFEGLFVLASALFVVGSFFFWPEEDEAISRANFVLGCRLFDVGSIIFAVLSLYSVVEGCYLRRTKRKHRLRWRGIFEQAMYLGGSVVFCLGTLIWDPDVFDYIKHHYAGQDLLWKRAAVILFMVGSFMFSLAAFLNAMTIVEGHPRFTGFALFVALCFEFGGLLFVAGTAGFVPGILGSECGSFCERDMEIMGCLCYIVGSFLYLIGSIINLLKTIALNQLAREQYKAALKIQEKLREHVIAPREDAARQIQDLFSRHMGRRREMAAVRVQQTLRRRLDAKRAHRRQAAERIQQFWQTKQRELEELPVQGPGDKAAAAAAANAIKQFWEDYYMRDMASQDAEDVQGEQEIANELVRNMSKRILRAVSQGPGLDDIDEELDEVLDDEDDDSSSDDDRDSREDGGNSEEEKDAEARALAASARELRVQTREGERRRRKAERKAARNPPMLPFVYRAFASLFGRNSGAAARPGVAQQGGQAAAGDPQTDDDVPLVNAAAGGGSLARGGSHDNDDEQKGSQRD
eukprot:g4598.t1